MKTHGRNIVSLFGSDAIVRLLGFASTTYMARVLGGEAFGVVNLGLAVFSYGMIFASPGLHIIGTRMISQKVGREGATVRYVTSLRFLLALATIIIISGITCLIVHDATTRLVLLLYVAALLPFSLQIDWYYQGAQRIATLGITRAAAALLYLVLLLLLIASPEDIHLVPVAYFANVAVIALILIWFFPEAKTDHSPLNSKSAEPPKWSVLLRQGLPVGAATILSQAVLNLPVILLGVFSTSLEIGGFSAASRLVFFLLAIDRAIYILFYPLVARTASANPSELGNQVGRILAYLLIIALPICAGGIVLARPVIVLIFGSQYVGASRLLQILLFYFLFTVLNSIFSYVLIAVGNERRYSNIIVSLSSILLLALIPLTYYWKATGASLGLVLGELAMVSLMYRECRVSALIALRISFVRPLLCSVLMGVLLLLLPSTGVFVSIVLGIISYFSAMALTKGITKDDILFLKERLL